MAPRPLTMQRPEVPLAPFSHPLNWHVFVLLLHYCLILEVQVTELFGVATRLEETSGVAGVVLSSFTLVFEGQTRGNIISSLPLRGSLPFILMICSTNGLCISTTCWHGLMHWLVERSDSECLKDRLKSKLTLGQTTHQFPFAGSKYYETDGFLGAYEGNGNYNRGFDKFRVIIWTSKVSTSYWHT